MRILSFLLLLVSFSIGTTSHSYASEKPWAWGWWPAHWQGLDFKPYLGNQKIGQGSLWDDDAWTPEAWIKDAGDEKRIMRDFYATGIVVKQYKNGDNIPVLELGNQFIQLSGLDQRRILQFVDHVFNITKAEENGMFFVVYSEADDSPMGIYNKYGFQSY